MKIISATIAVALALAAVPSTSIAQPASPVALGVAFTSGNTRFTATQVQVAEVKPGGAGESMGLRPGDIITHAGGRRITGMGRLTEFIRSLKVGDAVELTVKRNGDSLQLKGAAMARQR